MNVRRPNVPSSADKDTWKLSLECHSVHISVKMNTIEERILVDHITPGWRIDNLAAHRLEVFDLYRGKGRLLEDAADSSSRFATLL